MTPRNGTAFYATAIGLLVSLIILVGCSPTTTKGTVPPPGPGGLIDSSGAPDFIAVAGRDGGIVGYAPKELLLPQPSLTVGRPGEFDIPVYGEDLRTLVGRLVPGKGYVPLGVDPDTVPDIPVQQAPSLGP